MEGLSLFLDDLRRGQIRRALTENRVFRPWFRTGCPSTPRLQALIMFNNGFLHIVRVFYTGAYRPPREFNWAVGAILLFCTFFLSCTGYLLPWDQLGIWAVTVGTNMAGATPFVGEQTRFLLIGGYEISDNTLIRWYVLHVIGMPLITAVLMAVHFWRIRKDGGISGPL